MREEDVRYMERALTLARAGWGRVHPNPMVGAVIVRAGRVVGEGWHAEHGGPHAEVAALAAAGTAARGATMYVTLEPCAHHGKTPPCTDAIRQAGIRRVVYGATDPNRTAAGGGALLAAAGLTVDAGVLEAEAVGLDPAFHWTHRHDTPWVELKLAQSLDSRISAAEGVRSPVTGPESLARTHRLRAGFDAILVGRRTAEVDDPLLTVRGDIVPRVPPARVVFDASARTRPDARLFGTPGGARTILVVADDAPPDRTGRLSAAGAHIVRVPRSEAGVDVFAALAALWREGIRSVLCEGGGRLAASLLASDVVGRLHLFIAPKLLGDAGVPAFPAGALPGEWTVREAETLGRDTLLVLDRANREG